MGLRDDILEGLAEAFDNDLFDAAVPIVVTQNARGGYDPATGTVTSPNTSSQNTRGIFDDYLELEVFNSAIEPGDTRIMILSSEISSKPLIGANIIRVSDNKLFRIISVAIDPANCVYFCQSRSIHT